MYTPPLVTSPSRRNSTCRWQSPNFCFEINDSYFPAACGTTCKAPLGRILKLSTVSVPSSQSFSNTFFQAFKFVPSYKTMAPFGGAALSVGDVRAKGRMSYFSVPFSTFNLPSDNFPVQPSPEKVNTSPDFSAVRITTGASRDVIFFSRFALYTPFSEYTCANIFPSPVL